jgi:poly(3-hydroxybutyrate) depolymerase
MRWPACAPGTEVIFVTLTDGGHTWPDRNDNLGVDANEDVLRFFLRHARP